jgi:sec-independent protein translocase protein TatC
MSEEFLANFWDHVEELRHTFLQSLLIIFLGFILAFYFYEPLVNFLTLSWQKTQLTSSTPIKQVIKRERLINSTSQPINYAVPQEASAILISEGVESLHFPFYRLQPIQYIEYSLPERETQLVLLSPLEGLLIAFKVCLWVSVALTSPFWIYLVLKFVMPGLNQQERLIIIPFILNSIAAIAIGTSLAYYGTIPLTNFYLESFNATIGKNLWSLSEYIDYTLIIFLGHTIAFELCLILLFMVHFRLLSAEWLISKRRYMIVTAFILGALLTPPDVLTQLLLALPLVGIYELAILYAKLRRQSSFHRELKEKYEHA